MHILGSMLLIFLLCILLIAGFLQVLKALMERDFFSPPAMEHRDPQGSPFRSAASATDSGAGAMSAKH